MRNLFYSFLLMFFALHLGFPAAAQDPSPQPKLNTGLCAQDSRVCRSLAVEVAKLNIADRIDSEIASRRNTNLLCPQDDPQCCPPRLMPFCSALQRNFILGARSAYRNVSLTRVGECPVQDEICDAMETFCAANERWLPWAGCVDLVSTPPIHCEPGWSQNGLTCVPPPSCECGFEPNGNGKCIPKTCYARGARVRCADICSIEERQVAIQLGPAPVESNLGQNLRDIGVQIEAAQGVRAELKATLEAVEREIRELELEAKGGE